ncbi:enoyl-CoA hydratase/isomerase family protein [Allohahella marinimesophila]|uniref:Isohexenylglutaconyl-CoA hydratase n=1 Tax=Allohahella marinimesophila TaxID=1054972 RepID=A0ABP7NGT0_9GAMM
MNFPATDTLKLDFSQGVLRVVLSRPKVRNAMSLQMVKELIAVFEAIDERNASAILTAETVRVVVISGEGQHFCAGADISDMAGARQRSSAGNASSHAVEGLQQTSSQQIASDPFAALNRAFGTMLMTIDQAPCAVVVALDGAVLGGGFGLACVSDHAIAAPDTRFGLPETSLGILPAQIAPFVVRRIGLTQARSLALLGRRFGADEALRLGVIHDTVDSAEALEGRVEAVIAEIRRCAPRASRETKALLHRVDPPSREPLHDILDAAALGFSAAVRGDEGAEGTMAFMEKRKPRWEGDQQ